jgi:hypothetical protein
LELIGEGDPFLLEALDDLLVGLAHLLRVVVALHRLLQPLLERPDLLYQRVVRRRPARLLGEVAQPVVQPLEVAPLEHVGVGEVVVPAAKHGNLLVELFQLHPHVPLRLGRRLSCRLERRGPAPRGRRGALLQRAAGAGAAARLLDERHVAVDACLLLERSKALVQLVQLLILVPPVRDVSPPLRIPPGVCGHHL